MKIIYSGVKHRKRRTRLITLLSGKRFKYHSNHPGLLKLHESFSKKSQTKSVYGKNDSPMPCWGRKFFDAFRKKHNRQENYKFLVEGDNV